MHHRSNPNTETNQQTGGFSGTNTLTTAPVGGKSNAQNVLSQPIGFRLAQAFTVEFAITPPYNNGATTPSPVNCVAEVDWVENGNSIKRKVSVTNGTSLTGTGSGVQVTLQDVALGASYVGGLLYNVTTVIAPGVRGSVAELPIYQDTVPTGLAPAPAGTLVVPIPQDAGVRAVEVSVVNTTNTNATSVVVQAVNPGLVSLKAWNPSGQPQMTPLPPGATQLVIGNLAADPVFVSVIWGIDG